MFPSIGIPELILILVIALVIFGPGKLPEIGKAVGKSIREFRSASNENDTKTIKITISLGIYQFKSADKTQDLLMNADKALYEAKESGRNMVKIYKKNDNFK